MNPDDEAKPKPEKDFFISYNKADRAWAEWIAWQLEAAGYTTIIQAWDFRPGGNLVLEMHKGAVECERTIAVLSNDYLQALYTQPEWAAAFALDPTGKKGILLPVRVAKCELMGLLKPIIYIDLFGCNEVQAKNSLLEGVKRGKAKPSSAPIYPGSPIITSPKPNFPGSLPPVWYVPHLRNPNFTGRDEILTNLRAALTSGRTGALTQVFAGLGGVGKTQIALEYTYRHKGDYKIVWWLAAENQATLAPGYIKLGETLGLGGTELKQPEMIDKVRLWLGHNKDWLLVFDNAENPSDLDDFLPQGETGHVIITSRRHDWDGVAEHVDVEVMKPDEAIEFLLKRTKSDDKETVAALAEELGYLPLALEHAGAFISKRKISTKKYLELYEQSKLDLLKRSDPPKGYQATVATTWDVSLSAISEIPGAMDLMNLSAFMAPDRIPLSIIVEGSEFLPPDLKKVVIDEVIFLEAVSALDDYSLAEKSDDFVSVHRLLQAVVREKLSDEQRKMWAEMAIRIVAEAYPKDVEDHRNWDNCSILTPHALITADFAEKARVVPEAAAYIWNQMGLYMRALARYNTARLYHEKGLKIAERVHGPGHPDVASMLNSLGSVLQILGDFAGAKTNFESFLEITVTVYGPDHPFVATGLNNLGLVLRDMGDFTRAKTNFERALQITEAAYGPDHPKVANVLNNLGLVLWDLGDLESAKTYIERALKIDQAV
jgi:tetratricopeptide (TPR) repeat protein